MLKGTLEEFALADIFRLLSWAKKTGKLDVARSAGSGKIFFRDGEVYYAESSISREPLGQKLIRSGLLTEGQLVKALDQNASSGERVGQILVDNGWVAPEQLQAALRQQIEDAVFDLLRWELGEFQYDQGVEADIEVQISVSVENLIIEASRRLDELEVIERKIPSELAILKMSNKPPEGAAEINITPDEWRMLVLVDGARTVHEIAKLVGMDDFGALRGLYGLVSAGLVEVILPEHSAPQGGGEPVAPFQGATPQGSPAGQEPVEEGVQEASEAPAVVAETQLPTETVASALAEMAATQAPVVEDSPSAVEETVVGAASEPEVEPLASTTFTQAPTDEPVEASSPDAGGWTSGAMSSVFRVEEEATEPADVSDETMPEAASPEQAPVVEGFDAPGPNDLVETKPDPFLNDLLNDEGPQASAPAVAGAPATTANPAPPAPSPAHPQVDRTTVVRELAGLFSDDERIVRTAHGATEGASEDERKRIEDDDQLNKGLISRLIDGVKGL